MRITRAGDVLWGPMPGKDWTVFAANHSTYEALETATLQVDDGVGHGGLPTNVITVLRVIIQTLTKNIYIYQIDSSYFSN